MQRAILPRMLSQPGLLTAVLSSWPMPLALRNPCRFANTHGTGKVADNALEAALVACMPLTPRNIRDQLGLNRAIYAPSAAYGHFGRTAGGRVTAPSAGRQQTSRIVSQLPSDVTAAACWRWRTVTKIADGVRHMMPERPQFYGRRKGRRLRPTMQGLMAEQLPGCVMIRRGL